MIVKIEIKVRKYFLVCLLKITIKETRKINSIKGILFPDKIKPNRIIIYKKGIRNFKILGENFL